MSLAKKTIKLIDENVYEIAFLIAAGSAVASVVLSNMLELVPCLLCWYQRIFMFPLPFILAVAILRKDKHAFLYVLPLSVIGTLIAFYNILLEHGIITEEASSCTAVGPSCAEPQIEFLGFMTIAFGSFMSFLSVTVLMIWAQRKHKKDLVIRANQQYKLSRLLLAVLVATITAVALLKILDVDLVD